MLGPTACSPTASSASLLDLDNARVNVYDKIGKFLFDWGKDGAIQVNSTRRMDYSSIAAATFSYPGTTVRSRSSRRKGDSCGPSLWGTAGMAGALSRHWRGPPA